MRRVRFSVRLRTVLLAAVFSFTTFAVAAAPADLELPLPEQLRPEAAQADFCAGNPSFSGHLTASSSSTAAVSRITSDIVYGYISNVAAAWSCTAYYRYSGAAWNTTASTGRFNWGNLINSVSVACNWLVGTTDYLKANTTNDCADSDAEYAMAITLTAERQYQANVAHNSIGDLSYVHSDCGTYYGGEIGKGSEAAPESFSASDVGNRPGSNCDPLTLDNFGTSQIVTLDWTVPVTTISAPTGAIKQAATSYTVQWQATDNLAGFGGTSDWDLQRQIATATNGSCGSFANDTAAGNLVSGTAQTAQSQAQTLVTGKCYRWTLAATDQNGNAATLDTSGTVLVDSSAPVADFTTPNENTTTLQGSTSYTVAWTESDPQSGVTARSLQRQRAAVATPGSCAGLSFANDGSASTATSPVGVTGLLNGYCYRWVQTLTNGAGTQGSATSGSVMVDTGAPTVDFTTPNEGMTTIQNATSYSVAWTETEGGSGVASRSLQRQRGTIVTGGTCAGVSFANDGSPSTAASPVNSTGLLNGYCYRWVQTLTDAAGNPGSSTSGSVLVDTTAPGATLALPEANRVLGGTYTITGTATDASSFKEFQLEYAAGTVPPSWTSIGIFTAQVTPTGTLATWATGTLTGTYTLRLTVRDNAGNTTQVTRLVYLDNSHRGSEDYWTRVPFDLGGGYELAIGVASGEAALSRDLFTIPSYGPPQALSLAYSSQEPSSSGRFGTGWMSNLTQYLSFEDGFVVWHRQDGGRVPFGDVAGTWTPLRGHFETLTRGSGEDTITLKDQSRLVFENSGAGRLKRIENRFGKALTLSWGTSSATMTDASGRGPANNITIDSGSGRITAVADYAGRSWGFAYTLGDLTTITDPAGKTTALTYSSDGSHRLTSIARQRTPASGSAVTITWTIGYTSGKATTVLDPIGDATGGDPAHTFTYNAGNTVAGLLKTYSPVVRNNSTHTFDALGRVTSLLDAESFTTTKVFDAESNLTSLSLPIDGSTSATTTYTYDARGNVLTETRPIDGSTSVTTLMTYNATNDLLIRSEADNDSAVKLVTKHAYDGSGHLTSVNVNCTTTGTTPPADASTCTGAGTQDSATNLITTYTYTSNDQLDTETDPLGRVTKHVYDTNGNETSVIRNFVSGESSTHERNVTATYAYDPASTAGKAGLVTAETDPLANQTTFGYDNLGRRTSEALPGDTSIPALTRTTAYDELGNVLTETEAWTPLGGGSPVTRTTTRVYDLRNRETSVTDPAGVASTTAYDAAGNATSTTSGGVTTTRVFDGLGRTTSETTAGKTTTHDYDAQGRETTTTNPEGEVTSRVFNSPGLLVEERVDPTGLNLVTSHTYDRLARERAVTDPELVETTTLYDRAGRLTSTTVAGATTSHAYDRASNRTSTTSPLGIVETTAYDPLDRPTHVIGNDVASPTLPTEDLTTTTYYDAGGQAIALKDPRGITTRTMVNVRGLAKQAIENCTDSGTTPTADPPNCSGAGTHDPKTNVVSTLTYDGSGAVTIRLVAQGTGAEATAETAYDAAGRAQAVKDPRGTVTRTMYDAVGRVDSTILNCTEDTSNPQPPGASWWTCDGSVLEDGTWNAATSYEYDTRGNRIKETAPNGRLTTYAYDDANRVIERIDNDVAGTPTAADQDLSTFFYYDDAGRQIAVKAPTVDRTTFTVTRSVFDDNGRLIKEIRNCTDSGTSPPANPATCSGAGTADADTNLVTEYAYDDRGNRVVAMAADPGATTGTSTALVRTRYVYDGNDRLCRGIENSTQDDTAWASWIATADECIDTLTGTASSDVSTRYTYDGAGNLASMIDGRGKTTTYAYDALGQMTSLTDANGKRVDWTYDGLGRRTSQTERGTPPLSTVITWTYDGAGRILSRTANGAATSYTYDDNGNRLTAAAGSGTITATYDRLNRVLTVDDEDAGSGADTTYTYSLASPSWTDPTGSYAVTLDKFDRQTTLTDPIHGASTFTWTYHADGQLATHGAPNGNTTTVGYDDAGALVSKLTEDGSSTDRANYAWTRNRAGHILSEASTITGDPANGTTTYAYDTLGRLTSSTRAASTTAYGWQAVPNRDSVQVGANPAVTTSFDDANRPTSDSAGGSYSHDLDGRMTARPGQQLEWDALSRLTRVKDGPGTTTLATYTYDALDRLLIADYGGSNRLRYRYVGLTTSVAQVIDDVTSTVTRHVATEWTGGRLVDWTGSGSNQRFYGTNSHHDVTWTADSTGAVTATLRYDPWGNLTSSTGSSLPSFRFQSSLYDSAVDLSWVVTRWYAPSLGRFVSEDSVLGEPVDPPSRHLYAYAEGAPIARWDPDGKFWYRTRVGDSLRDVAAKYLGNPGLSRRIARANHLPLRRTTVNPGQCLWIPTGGHPVRSSGCRVGGSRDGESVNFALHSRLYGNKRSASEYWTLRHTESIRGRFRLAMFIPKDEVWAGAFMLRGDSRGFDSHFSRERSRASLEIDFDRQRVWAYVTPSCGKLWRVQPVDATIAASIAAGVSNSRVLRGRALSLAATASRSAWL
jgi:RHS repeat-associated protein